MKIAYVSTYPPRECGIGTFTQNLAHSMLDSDGVNDIMVISITDHQKKYNYPPEVKFTIQNQNQSDYIEAADFINHSGADICVLEHEFGIFGGDSGIYILPLLHRLTIPIISTLHTILKTPSYNEKAILKEICKMSDKVIVMSNKAVEFLTQIYDIPKVKIELISHGVPDIHFNKEQSRTKFRLNDRKLLMTFGFVGRNKGIETVIKALPEIIKKHPEVLYIVLGKTHPNVLRHAGEEYRNYLQMLIKNLGVEDHVLLLNKFIDQRELFKYLAACDIYITPYLSEAQITSGTLTYAMGSGCAVVSTPYWHAAELLAEDRGRLFNFSNSKELSQLLNHLFDNPEELAQIQKKARDYGKNITWPKIGKKYTEVAKASMLKEKKATKSKKENIIDLHLLPPFSLNHIRRLTDDTGIIQHAKFGIPNLKEGYCLDDNARALLMVCMCYNQKKYRKALELMPIYLSYIHYMQNSDGSFRNFLSFNRNYLDEVGSEDSFGRTIWAMGYLLSNPPNDAYYQTGRLIFFDAVPHFEKLNSIRGIANTIIGICHYLQAHSGDEEMKQILNTLSHTLVAHYDRNKSENWHWFESLLAYDNAILPLALLHSTQILKDKRVKEVAFESMEFLIEHTMKDGTLSVIGNREWFVKDGERSNFAQQPIDAQAMVLMFHQAYVINGDREFLRKLFISFMWFLGENDMRMSLFDFETKGCCDGFEDYGVNRNQGAESSLAYLISFLTVLKAYDESYHLEKIQNSVNKNTQKHKAKIIEGKDGETLTSITL